MNSSDHERNIAKTALYKALAEYRGNTKSEAVMTAVKQLAQLNPTVSPAKSESLLDNQWLLISAPNFPGGTLSEDGRYSYTLGRLAFNMFQPTQLKVVIERVLQPVTPIEGQQRTHDIITEFTIQDDRFPKLQGIVHNFGVCTPYGDDTLQVQFTGGTLAPKEDKITSEWISVFGEQSSPAKKSLKDRWLNLIFKIMFGLVPPSGMDQSTGRVTFEMQKSPKGKLKILYLDEELRITLGERGMILVCQRR